MILFFQKFLISGVFKMSCKLNMLASCLLLSIFLSACAPKVDFEAITNDYSLAKKQLSVNEEKSKKLEQQLQEMEEEKAKLNDQMKTLRKTIRKKETVISIQGKVIKLLDDSDQTLQKSIEEQIAAQNIKMNAFSPSP